MASINTSKAGKQILNAMQQVLDGDVISYEVKRDLPDIRELREELGMERNEFAAAFNLSKYSVRNWELGMREPRGPALTLLQMIQADPWRAYKMLHPKH